MVLVLTLANIVSCRSGIATALREFYRTQRPESYIGKRQQVEEAVQGTTAVYRRNVFPEMNVNFGTYPNNIGHMDFPRLLPLPRR